MYTLKLSLDIIDKYTVMFIAISTMYITAIYALIEFDCLTS